MNSSITSGYCWDLWQSLRYSPCGFPTPESRPCWFPLSTLSSTSFSQLVKLTLCKKKFAKLFIHSLNRKENELEFNGTVPYPDRNTVAVILSDENEQLDKRKWVSIIYVHIFIQLQIATGADALRNICTVYSKQTREIKRRIKVAFLIGVCYAANIGGIGTLIGSGAPLAFQGILEEYN